MDHGEEHILLKCGELVLKGLNRRVFEQQLLRNVKHRLAPCGPCAVLAVQSTIYIRPTAESSAARAAFLDRALRIVPDIYGVAAYCRCASCAKDIDAVCALAPSYCAATLSAARTFAVTARRADKMFPLTSPEIGAAVGAAVLAQFPHLSVDLDNPDCAIRVEIRDTEAFVHTEQLPGAGGLPVGMGGRALLLLSGGIDSPVAGLQMAKRGVRLDAVHFESPPYTGPRAKQKVLDLAQRMTRRCGDIRLTTVSLTALMETIRAQCPEDLFTLILRRFMLRIAGRIAALDDIPALVTGESLGQVASQTMASIAVTDAVRDRLVLRPLIGMDKEEIIQIARRSGTFDISTLPFEDCCTVFTPRHPKTQPHAAQLEEAEACLDTGALVDAALAAAESALVKYGAEDAV